MKNRLLILIAIIFTGSSVQINAQFTKGGTYKNYEKYHVTYDTIKTVRTVATTGGQMEKVGYFFFNVGPAIPISKPFTRDPEPFGLIDADYGGYGGLGGSTGVDIGIGGVYGIPAINKHLVRQIDLAVYQSANFTYLPWTYASLGAPNDGYDYNGFMAISTCVGPAIIINPVIGTDFHIDFAYRLGLGVTFGGGFEDSGSSLVERDEIGYTFYHGPTLNFRYSILLVGMELSLLGDYGTTYISGSGSYYMQCAVPLNNFAIKVGVKI
jgi:hypothetical protein